MELTRREALALLLGAGFAAGCPASRSARRPLPPGEIVGAAPHSGHRLRSGAPPLPPEETWRRVPVIVVGAGVAGLSAAWRLARAGLAPLVLELEAAIGGTARSGTGPVVPYPWGAHYIAAPSRENADLVALLEEMGVVEGRDAEGEPVVGEQYHCRDPEERVFFRGRWYEGLYLHEGESDDDIAQRHAFEAEIHRWVAFRDARGRRAFTIPTASASDDPAVRELDRLSMAEWLDARGLTSPRLRWLVDYACRDDYGTRPDRTSAWAGIFYFAARMPHPGAETRSLVTWPEGNGRLVAHLARGVETLTNRLVVDVTPLERGAVVTALHGDRVEAWRADRVILAAPQLVAGRVLRPWREKPPGHLASFEYGSWWVANLHLEDRPQREEGFPLAWDNVLYESDSLGYVVATHQRGLDHGPTVFTYYRPLCDGDPAQARRELLALERDAFAEAALAELEVAHPEIRSLVTRLDVARWGHAMVRPKPGFFFGGAREQAMRPVGAVHFAHSDLGGLPLFEEAFAQGVRAADEVRGVH